MQVYQNSESSDNIDLMSMILSNKHFNSDQFETKTFQKNKYIYLPEDKSDNIYFIKKGRVKIGSQIDFDKKFIKDILREGDFFGEHSLFGSSNQFGFATAMEETIVMTIPCDKLKILMQKNSKLYFLVIQALGSRLIETEQRIEAFVFKDSRSRIINFIKKFVRKNGKRVGFEVVIWKVLTHQEIANFTDTSRQTVTTVLNELRNKNILAFSRRRLLIRDMEMLIAEVT